MTDSPDDAAVTPRTRREAASRRDDAVPPAVVAGRAEGREPHEHARAHLEYARDQLGHAREQFEAGKSYYVDFTASE